MSDGQRVVVQTTRRRVRAAHRPDGARLRGQGAARRRRARAPPSAGRERARTAYELYLRASQLDEDPATIDEAEALYAKPSSSIRGSPSPTRTSATSAFAETTPRPRSALQEGARDRRSPARGPVQPRLRDARARPARTRRAALPGRDRGRSEIFATRTSTWRWPTSRSARPARRARIGRATSTSSHRDVDRDRQAALVRRSSQLAMGQARHGRAHLFEIVELQSGADHAHFV